MDLDAHVTIKVEPVLQYRLDQFQVRCRNYCLCRLCSQSMHCASYVKDIVPKVSLITGLKTATICNVDAR